MIDAIAPHPVGSAVAGALALIALAATLEFVMPTRAPCQTLSHATPALEATQSACLDDEVNGRGDWSDE